MRDLGNFLEQKEDSLFGKRKATSCYILISVVLCDLINAWQIRSGLEKNLQWAAC